VENWTGFSCHLCIWRLPCHAFELVAEVPEKIRWVTQQPASFEFDK
jgi:hypothetical protein